MSHDIKHELDKPDSSHDHWIEITKISEDNLKAVKKDSMPVRNEDKYHYVIKEDGELEFESGKHKCSTGWRSTSPGDSLDQKIRELSEPLTPGV